MRSIADVPSAEHSALQGIQRAHTALDTTAAAIAGAHNEPPARVDISPAARSLAEAPARDVDLASELTNMSLTKHFHGANVKVLESSQEMQRDLMQLLESNRKT